MLESMIRFAIANRVLVLFAAVLVAVLDTPQTAGLTFDVISGDTAIPDALA